MTLLITSKNELRFISRYIVQLNTVVCFKIFVEVINKWLTIRANEMSDKSAPAKIKPYRFTNSGRINFI